MKTAQNVTRIGLARAKGEHLSAANESLPPSELKRWKDKTWRYVPSNATDISKTFARIRRQQQAAQKKGRK